MEDLSKAAFMKILNFAILSSTPSTIKGKSFESDFIITVGIPPNFQLLIIFSF